MLLTISTLLFSLTYPFRFHGKQGSLKDSYIPRLGMTIERPQNSRLKLVAFNCDLDLEFAFLTYGVCTSSH